MKTPSLPIPFIKCRKAKQPSKKHLYLSLLQIVLGINRLYLFQIHCHKVIIYFSYLYTLFVFLFVAGSLLSSEMCFISNSYKFYSIASILEYAITILNALLQRKSLLRLFDILEREDTTLRFDRQGVAYRWSAYLAAILSAQIISEVIIWSHMEIPGLMYTSYIPVCAQDSEILFYCFLLNQLYTRIETLKGHVERVIADRNGRKVQKSKAKNVSISSMHEEYDLLRTCSRSINTAFNLTLSSIFLFCGTATTFGVQNMFVLVKLKVMYKEMESISYIHTILFIIFRCIKCAYIVTMPCYCCTLVKNQAKTIRSLLYSGINARNKNQRDELKAFFQLTKDNDFSHKLFSVVSLAMDFPLKYLNTCLTYIIILIQFSKFID